MRLTVGPLPPAVYWRRRAVVLGAVLLFLIVVIYSCRGPGETDDAAQHKGPSPSGGPSPVLTPETGGPGSAAPSDPPGGGSAEEPGEEVTGPPSGGGQLPGGAPPVQNACTDAEMSVIPVPSQTSMPVGGTIQLRLRIKNVSDRTCNRDVGAAMQELYIKSGARTIWSSDACSSAHDNNVKTFPPSHEEEYSVPWNGRESSRCANGFAAGPHATAGSYQLFGRLGTKHSDPVSLTITS